MSLPLKIAFDARSLRGERTGVGNYLANLLEHLLDVDPSIAPVLVADGDLSSFPWLEHGRVRVVRTGGRSGDNFVWTNWALRRAVVSSGAAVFHSPGYTKPLGLRIPSIVTLHDISYAAHPEWYPHAGGWLRQQWYRASALSADRILTDSEFSRREIKRVYHALQWTKIVRVYLGVDGRRFFPRDDPSTVRVLRRRYGLEADFILFVGDVHARRNLPRIAEALARLRASRGGLRTLELVVIGRVLDGAGLPQTTAGVRSLGYVPDADLPLFYNAARAFVFPSSYEGFGLGVLEAMASGCPVVTARATSCAEIAGGACLEVEPTDVDSIAAAIAAILESPERAARLRADGLARARAFDWRRMAEETLAVYRELVR